MTRTHTTMLAVLGSPVSRAIALDAMAIALATVVILPSHRGDGLGSAALARVLEVPRELGFRAMYHEIRPAHACASSSLPGRSTRA